jgi:precorrin-6B methylase 2
MIEKLKRAWFSLEDRLFDLRHGIDTRHRAADRAAVPAETATVAHATSYQAVWTRNLRVLIRAARRHAELQVFVDVGAGKGKACIYASPLFAKVIGVEYSADLVHEARINCERAGRRNIILLLADACEYDLPAQACLVFLFNPFDAVVLRQFAHRNLERLRAHGSLIAYANDVQRDTLAQLGLQCLFRDPARNISLWRVAP